METPPLAICAEGKIENWLPVASGTVLIGMICAVETETAQTRERRKGVPPRLVEGEIVFCSVVVMANPNLGIVCFMMTP